MPLHIQLLDLDDNPLTLTWDWFTKCAVEKAMENELGEWPVPRPSEYTYEKDHSYIDSGDTERTIEIKAGQTVRFWR